MARLVGDNGKILLLRYQEGVFSTEQREKGFVEAIVKVAWSSQSVAKAVTSADVNVPIAIAIGANRLQTTRARVESFGLRTSPTGGRGSCALSRRLPGLPRSSFSAVGCGRRPLFALPTGEASQ